MTPSNGAPIEPAAELFGLQVGGEDLDGDLVPLGVAGLPHLAHPALAQAALERADVGDVDRVKQSLARIADTAQRRRLSVKPGLTCLWQVSGRNTVDFDQWMRLDLEYVDNWSPLTLSPPSLSSCAILRD